MNSSVAALKNCVGLGLRYPQNRISGYTLDEISKCGFHDVRQNNAISHRLTEGNGLLHVPVELCNVRQRWGVIELPKRFRRNSISSPHLISNDTLFPDVDGMNANTALYRKTMSNLNCNLEIACMNGFAFMPQILVGYAKDP